jgi:adenosylmethionine-8-amino-7-oxononanoate aminotransferase
LAFGHWHHRSQPEKKKFIALGNAYHGDTIGAVSLGGIDLFHAIYKPMLFDTEFAPSPYCYRCPLGCSPDTCNLACADQVGELLDQHRGEIAAVIVEPLVQCAAGMITAPPGHLTRIRQLCDKYDTLLIADEVATGLGRTGRMFACDHERVQPDLLCISKGLTGGYMPLAATLASEQVYESFLGRLDEGKTFYHGHTFTGNPLGCAAALATLSIFDTDHTLEAIQPKQALIAEKLTTLAQNPHVGDVRQWGMIAGVELVRNKATAEAYPYSMQVGAQVCAHAQKYHVILRPLADVIVIMPPLTISLENLTHLLDTVERCINEVVPVAADGISDGLE